MEAIYDNHNFISICEFLPNQLYFVTVQNINNGGSCDAIIPHTDNTHYFSTDNELVYHNFHGDFGPLSITCLYKFCKKLTNKLAAYGGEIFYEKFIASRFGRKDIAEKLQGKFVKKKIIVYYTSTNNEKRANAAFLIAAYAVLYLDFSPRLAYKALQPTKMRYRPFQDASVGLSPYKINMKNCLDALHKASTFGFFNFNDFNAADCSHFENIEHGDLNWIIPQKFVAFPGPVEEKNDYYHHPYFYIEYFLCNNVTDVVRLNQRAYDSKCFTMFNIKHHDLYMQDGSDPPDPILKNFMHIAETAAGAIAVHCKAGLGRTGSLIGAYLLKHYRMTAKEAIAWIRICRPGSVIGHQQTWLENLEEELWYEGNEWRYKVYGKREIVPFLHYGIYSLESPKKEFPGLKELLVNLTKRSRYRFIVKNRSKKSKTKLQQIIKNLLENGKSTHPSEFPCPPSPIAPVESKSEKSTDIISCEPKTSFPSAISQKSSKGKQCYSKNVHYLKPPPPMEGEINNKEEPYPYEYSQVEYRKPLPQKECYVNEYDSSNYYQKPMDTSYESSYSNYPVTYNNKLQGMYSNPNSFNPTSETEYFQALYDKNPLTQSNVNRMVWPIDTQKMYAEPSSTMKYERTNPASKLIDKNWKQNTPLGEKYYNQSGLNKKYRRREAPLEKPHEEVCAFDFRVDTISPYSRINKSYLNKNYLDQPQMNPPNNSDYYSDTKLKSYDYGKSAQQSHGFLLSPEDLKTWVETFNEKVCDTSRDQQYERKRPSVM